MQEKKILGLNTCFENAKIESFTEVDFKSPTSMLDYDVVLIDTAWPFNSYSSSEWYNGLRVLGSYDSTHVVEDFSRVRRELVEFLKSGRNVYVILSRHENCCIYTGETRHSGTGKNTRITNIVKEFGALSFLPLNISLEFASGNKITSCCSYPYQDFFSRQKETMHYTSYFQSKIGIPLAKISRSDCVVSAVCEYEKGKIIFLPDVLTEEEFSKITEWKKYAKSYFECLIDLDNRLHSNDEYILPEWSKEVCVPGEKTLNQKIQKCEDRIKKVKNELEKNKKLLNEKQKIKFLIAGTGKPLENIVKTVLADVGFVIKESEEGRTDICAEYEKQPVVFEVKGLSKSAAEKNAAQLEKWASIYFEQYGKQAKPILVVNTFKDLPIYERSDDSFPSQMIPYATSRGHCLITTVQLLCMYIDIMTNPDKSREIVLNLIHTIGIYDKYTDYNTYLEIFSE